MRDYLASLDFSLKPGAVNRLPPVSWRKLHEGIPPDDYWRDLPWKGVDPAAHRATVVGLKMIDARTGRVETGTAEQVRAIQRQLDLDVAPMRDALEKHLTDAILYGTSAIYVDGNGRIREYPGRADRYWPATSEDHLHMHDLTLSPAPKGGYTVLNYDDDVIFAGKLDDCTTFMAEHMEEQEDKRATAEQEATARAARENEAKARMTEANRIREEAEARAHAVITGAPNQIAAPAAD
jgi:hypothetical protein